jgi:hypothetical protein
MKRRKFVSTAISGSIAIAAAGIPYASSIPEPVNAALQTRNNKLKRMASNSYAVNAFFKRRATHSGQNLLNSVISKRNIVI